MAETANPDVCYFHWKEQKATKLQVALVRLSCPDCGFFQIIGVCEGCRRTIQIANDKGHTRRCVACQKAFPSKDCRLVIGKV
jgi:hypothetical protein